jgi:hypothetical protein
MLLEPLREAETRLAKRVSAQTERRRSRTYRAVGYTTAPVLKVRAGRSGGFVSAVLSHPRFAHVTSVRVRWVEGSTSSGD